MRRLEDLAEEARAAKAEAEEAAERERETCELAARLGFRGLSDGSDGGLQQPRGPPENEARRAPEPGLSTLGALKGAADPASRWYERHPGHAPCPSCCGQGSLRSRDLELRRRTIDRNDPRFLGLLAHVSSRDHGTKRIIELPLSVRSASGPEVVGLDVRELEYCRFPIDGQKAARRLLMVESSNALGLGQAATLEGIRRRSPYLLREHGIGCQVRHIPSTLAARSETMTSFALNRRRAEQLLAAQIGRRRSGDVESQSNPSDDSSGDAQRGGAEAPRAGRALQG
jgi:hypothetical protein